VTAAEVLAEYRVLDVELVAVLPDRVRQGDMRAGRSPVIGRGLFPARAPCSCSRCRPRFRTARSRGSSRRHRQPPGYDCPGKAACGLASRGMVLGAMVFIISRKVMVQGVRAYPQLSQFGRVNNVSEVKRILPTRRQGRGWLPLEGRTPIRPVAFDAAKPARNHRACA